MNGRGVFGLVALVASTTLVSCTIEGPFARDNPWDTGSDVLLELTGPDSVHSIGDLIDVVLRSSKPIPAGGVIIWKSNESGGDGPAPETQVFTAGPAQFVVRQATAQYSHIAVSAFFDERIVAWSVWVGQRTASLDLYCGPRLAPFPCDAAPMSPGSSRAITAVAFDGNTNLVRRMEFAMARGTVVSRAPSVISTTPTQPNSAGTVTVQAVGVGSAWVVMRIENGIDSVRLVVSP